MLKNLFLENHSYYQNLHQVSPKKQYAHILLAATLALLVNYVYVRGWEVNLSNILRPSVPMKFLEVQRYTSKVKSCNICFLIQAIKRHTAQWASWIFASNIFSFRFTNPGHLLSDQKAPNFVWCSQHAVLRKWTKDSIIHRGRNVRSQ